MIFYTVQCGAFTDSSGGCKIIFDVAIALFSHQEGNERKKEMILLFKQRNTISLSKLWGTVHISSRDIKNFASYARSYSKEFCCALYMLSITLFFDRNSLNAFIEPKWALLAFIVLLDFLSHCFKSTKNKLTYCGERSYPTLWLGFLGLALISLYWLPHWTMGLVPLSCWSVLAIVGLLGNIAGSSEKKNLDTVLWSLSLIAVVQIVIGIWQAISLSKDLPRALIGTIGYHNFYSEFLILTCPFVGLIAINTKNRLAKGTWVGSLLAAMLVIFAIQSRAGIMGIVLISIIIGVSLWNKSGLRNKIKIVLAGVMLSMIFVSLILPVIPSRIGDMSWRTREDMSSRLVGRKLIWLASINMVLDNPVFGVGMGGFPFKYYDYQGEIIQSYPINRVIPAREVVLAAHNEFLQVACEIGIPGAVLFMVMLCWPVIKILRWNPRTEYDQRLRLTLLASLVGVFPSILVAFPFQVPATGPLIVFLSQIGYGRMSKDNKPHKISLPIKILVCFVGLLALIVLTRHYLSNRYLQQALNQEENSVELSSILYQKGIKWAPDKGVGKSIYGSYLIRNGKISEGRRQLTDSLKSFQDAYTYENLGRVAQREGDNEEALKYFRKSQMAGIHYFQDAADIAIIYAAQGNWEKAEKELCDILQYFPENRIIKNALGKIRLAKGDYVGAIQILSSMKKKSDAETWSLMGAALLAENKIREAEISIGKALNIEPDRIDSLNNMTVIYIKTGRTREAKALIEKVLKRDPHNVAASKNLQLLLMSHSKLASGLQICPGKN